MALTGELNDLSLAELIEFFCNQRKTGRLRVIYPIGAGYFYLKNGSVVDARFGDLRGIDAVFYALTQPNASRQLGILKNAGVVESRREGTWTYYKLAPQADDHRRRQLRALVDDFSDKGALRKDVEHLVKVRGPRACK